MDLDDTLFQTARHLSPEQQFAVASVDKTGKPLSYMTQAQHQFWQWLNSTTEVIPVTARNVEGLARVQQTLRSNAVCMHGGVVLNKDGSVDDTWRTLMQQHITPILPKIDQLHSWLTKECSKNNGRTWIATDNDFPIYLVVKQADNHTQTLGFLDQLAKHLQQPEWSDFYVHINGNSMGILPHTVNKAAAVEYLLNKINPTHQRIVIGWGDSLSDIAFLQHCDWWGAPKRSQVSAWTKSQLSEYIETHGAYQFLGR